MAASVFEQSVELLFGAYNAKISIGSRHAQRFEHSPLARLIPHEIVHHGSKRVFSVVNGDWIENQESAEVYLVSLDVRPESDLESFTGLSHLKAIPVNHGRIQDCGRGRHIFQIPADESFTKRCV